jgi:hypothetical protein
MLTYIHVPKLSPRTYTRDKDISYTHHYVLGLKKCIRRIRARVHTHERHIQAFSVLICMYIKASTAMRIFMSMNIEMNARMYDM